MRDSLCAALLSWRRPWPIALALFASACSPDRAPPPQANALFECADGNGRIPDSSRCDGVQDCIDASDEADCGFVCSADGGLESVSPDAVCNGVLDCSNGADEVAVDWMGKQCDSFFACGQSQALLPIDLRCDHYLDCPDGSDEDNATCTSSFSIVRCASGGLAFACDGRAECKDGSDELAPECEPFQCADGKLVPRAWECDGRADCAGQEDEPEDRCGDQRFTCKSGDQFVPKSWRCDASIDCADASDEADCEGLIFDCGDGLETRVPNFRLCDGREDCPNGRDERAAQACPETAFHCADGALIACVMHCDGDPSCDDGSDEVGCATLDCDDGGTYLDGQQCDLVQDCDDASDEADCAPGRPYGLCPPLP